MSGEVVELGTSRTFLVKRIEGLLESAKSGELDVLIAVTVYDNGKMGFVHSGALTSASKSTSGDIPSEYAKVVGMLSALQFDVAQTLHGMLESEEDDDE